MLAFLFIFLLFVIFMLPDYMWQRFGNLLKKIREQMSQSKIHQARIFSRHLDQVILHIRLGKEIARPEGAVYQPYSQTLDKLLRMRALLGSSISAQLQALKSDIHDEIIFLGEEGNIMKAAHVQFFSMILIILSFQFFSSRLLGLPFNFKIALYCFLLELLGFLIFQNMAKRRIFKLFKEANSLQGFFSEAESMLYGQLPANRVVQELAEIAPNLSGKKELEIRDQLFFLLKNWQQSGVPIRDDFKLLKSELYHYRREIMIRAKKFLDFLVFVILVLFFLSSYFLSLSPLFQVIFVA